MDVAKTRRVRYNGVGHKGTTAQGVLLNAGLPAAVKHLCQHLSFPGNVARLDTCYTGYESWIFDDVRHQLGRIAADGIEFEAAVADEVLEIGVGCDADAMAMIMLQFGAEGDERLYVTATPGDLNDNVEFWHDLMVLNDG